jgi:hypothetical protein
VAAVSGLDERGTALLRKARPAGDERVQRWRHAFLVLAEVERDVREGDLDAVSAPQRG